MSASARFSRQVVDLKTIHHRRGRETPSLSPFSTATNAATASRPKPEYTPPPVGVTLAKNLGRATFASRDFTAGEVLHSARSVVVHPCLSMINCLCYNCLRRLPEHDSPQTVSFCSKQCEQEAKRFYDVEKQVDWSRFHEYCRHGLKYPLIAKRFACQIISRKISKGLFELLHKAKMSPEEVSEDIKLGRIERGCGAAVVIRGNALSIELPVQSQEGLSSAAAFVEGRTAVGDGMYMLPSFYNHSCDPNVNIMWTDNSEGNMVALRDIEEGEEERISYLDVNMGYEDRKKYLYERYSFECNCHRGVSKS